MNGRISIRDLAEIAGVSRTTVSLALRGSHKVRPEVRKQIQELAAQKDYQSHPMVSALMQQVRLKKRIEDEEIIAFITSDPEPEQWKSNCQIFELWNGASVEAHRCGFRLVWFYAGPGARDSKTLANTLYHRGIRGLLFAPMAWPHPVFSIPWERFVPVACTASTGIAELPVVRSNQIRGARMLLAKLVEQGAKSIGVVVTEEDDARIENRWSMAIHAASVHEQGAVISFLKLRNDNDIESFRTWFKQVRPGVVVGLRPKTICGFLAELGCKPGVDLAYASLDVWVSDLGKVGGFFQDPFYLGQKAVQYISKAVYDQSMGLPTHPESVVVDGRIIDGSSLEPLGRRKFRTGSASRALSPMKA